MLRRRGDAWSLQYKTGGKSKTVALGVYGGEEVRPLAEKAAKAALAEVRKARVASSVMQQFGIERGKPSRPPLTVADWWDRYQTTYSPHKATRTQAIDTTIMGHWMPVLGGLQLADVRPMHCQDGLNRRRKAFAANPGRKTKSVITESTVQRERRFLQALFERAVENDLIDKNPWAGIKGVPDPSHSDRVLSGEDEVKLLAALSEERRDAVGRMVRIDPRYTRFVTFMLQTGLRLDELLNAHFTDKGKHLVVQGKFGKVRQVPLTMAARQALDDQIAADGKVWWQIPQRFREVMATACERAGILHLSPHDLRHTFGHRFLTRGGDIHTLSKLLGHASIAVTEKHYAYLRQEDIATRMLAVMEGAA